jgi:cytochrome P450
VTAEDTSLRLPLSTREVLDDPYGGFGRLREETRIARALWDGGPAWFVTRYEDVNAVLIDLVEHLADLLPITVICELVGVPAEDRPVWRRWNLDYNSKDSGRLNTMLGEMSAYIHELAALRRARPADDLITGLTRAHDEDDGHLSDTELVTMVLSLVIAAVETTPPLLGTGIMALLTHPGQLALLRADPSLAPAAVQEVLRWCGPAVVSKMRYATEDVTIGDTLIRQGDRVQVVLGSANHDPRRYPDPEAFDITRRFDTTAWGRGWPTRRPRWPSPRSSTGIRT